MKSIVIIGILVLITVSCQQSGRGDRLENEPKYHSTAKELQDSIIAEVFRSEILKTEGIFSTEWQDELDKALEIDSTIAYLWQQKAMPLFKQGKYELGMSFLDKAVKYDEREYLDYRAFMKCIFSKSYLDAIVDFEKAKKKYGDNYVMDHSYSFYIGLSKIQLNEFAEAEKLLEEEAEQQLKNQGEGWVHHLDLFYLGIARYEQNKYEEAIKAFNRALEKYPKFSEVLYYKAICTGRLGDEDEAKRLMEEAKKYGKQGFTINEDNSIYERYPYQIRWKLWD